ncbi:oligosaccharide flippase family protein [Shewanella chilikensis]|uniref:oligosaccharide flippase family protein n=1 Tax=Shewanella chilikensis TaxID=558541 RepID=UPI0039997EAE
MLKKNIFVNYISQIYVTLIGILLLPFYIKYMGSEAYGLVGFFSMLQAWFGVLDLGLTPTIGRETARYKGGSLSALEFRRLYRALSIIFVSVALIAGSVLLYISEFIAETWLNVTNLPIDEVVIAVQIMAISVSLRWMGGLFRGVLTGSEQLVWLSCFTALISTLRFIGVFCSMWLYGFTPLVFFVHQLCVALLEALMLGIKAQGLLPKTSALNANVGFSFKPIKKVLKFSLTIAFTSSVWVFVTQTDKLVLSGVLPLQDYGHFTLAILVANGIIMITGPISSAIMPRMTRLHSESKPIEMIKIYRQLTQVVSIIAGSAAITLIVCSKSLLIAWTGDQLLANNVYLILSLYAAGNLFLCVAAFSYYLQYAKGNLHYHLIGNIMLLIVLIPSIVWAATNFGGVGAGYVWLITNSVFLFVWVAYVHSKIEPGIHLKWIFNDVLKIIIPSLIAGYLIHYVCISVLSDDRLSSFITVALVGTIAVLVSYVFSEQKINFTNGVKLRILN